MGPPPGLWVFLGGYCLTDSASLFTFLTDGYLVMVLPSFPNELLMGTSDLLSYS